MVAVSLKKKKKENKTEKRKKKTEKEHKEALIQLTNKRVVIDDRKQTVANAINVMLDSIFRYFDDVDTKLLFPLPILYDL